MNKMKLYRIILVVVAFLIVTFLVAKDLAVCGNLSFETNFKRFTPLISILVPQARVMTYQYTYIEQEPVYFDIFMPRDFAKATLEFEYQNIDNKIIEIGVQTSESSFDLRPLENQLIDRLTWDKIEENGLLLLQKEKQFESIKSFLDNLPPISKIAAYNYELDYDFKIKNYTPVNKITELNNSLKGPYQIITYIENEDLYFEFEIENPVYDITPDSATLYVFDIHDNIVESFYPEGNKITAELKNLPNGVYNLSLNFFDDVYTNKIKTKQQKISFFNNINLVDKADLITDSLDLTFIAYMNDGLQTIRINDENLVINEIWQQYGRNLDGGINTIKTSKGQLSVTGDAMFSFSQEQFFNPFIKRLGQNTNLNREGIEFIISKYDLPIINNDTKINKVEFDLSNAYVVDSKLRFVISVPGLMESAKGVVIKNLKVNLARDSIFDEGIKQNIFNYLKHFYKNEIR